MTQEHIGLREAEEAVALLGELKKLESNRAFKKVILEGYFKELPIEMTPLLNEPHLSEASREGLMNQLKGVGALQAYFRSIYAKGNDMQQAIDAYHLGDLDEEDFEG